MQLDRITDLRSFDAERPVWEALEQRDPHATVFTSWRWLRAYLPLARHRWRILALRTAGETVAYLPLAFGGSFLDRELYLAGHPVADYTGMIAAPEHSAAAIAAFGDAILAERWDGFNVTDIADPRLERLTERIIERGRLRLESEARTPCRSVALPPDWETYITQTISAKTRVNALRVERRLAEAFPDFTASEAGDADIDAAIEAMIAVNHRRWGGNLTNARKRYGRLFRRAYDAGLARIFVYRDGARPIAGATAFLDPLRSTFGLYMIGFDEDYARFSPGKGIVARTIRAAIEGGYKRFDFLRGDEDFKARFAPDLHHTQHYRVARPGLRADAIAYARPRWFALKQELATMVYGEGRTV
jgi:CelD/BcsL family acetyltransferase involved in cellulose biosynthesis